MLRDSKVVHIGFALAIMFYVAGCAVQLFQPQQVTLAPRLSIAPVKIGAGAKVYITVADEQGTNVLGYKGDSLTWGRGNITTAEDLRAVCQKALSDGLANLGFNILAAPDPAASNLEVSQLRLHYMGITPDLPGPPMVFITAKATARILRGETEAPGGENAMLVHEKSYSVYHRQSFRGAYSSPEKIEEEINAAFSELISQLLVDVELLALLRTP